MDVWPTLCLGRSTHPEDFEGPITWQQSKKCLRDLVNDYEICFINWKKSGNHGSFGETDDPRLPFSNFIQNNNSLLYLHEYVYQFPHIFEKITGDLPNGAFSESTTRMDSESVTGSAKKYKRSIPKKDANKDGWEQFNKTYKQKSDAADRASKAAEYGSLVQSADTLAKDVRTQRDRKRKLLRDAAEESGESKQHMKERFERYKTKKQRIDPSDRSVEDNSDAEASVDSQESVFDECLQLSEVIERNEKQHEITLSVIDRFQIDKINWTE